MSEFTGNVEDWADEALAQPFEMGKIQIFAIIVRQLVVISLVFASLIRPVLASSFEDAKRYYADKDYAKAAQSYKEVALSGNAKAQMILGVLYQYGRGLDTDYAQAIFWYQKAANQEERGAQDRLGLMYENGQGVTKDFQQAAFWYRKAAEQGWGDAQFHLGQFYDRGMGVEQSYEQAAVWYRKAADQMKMPAVAPLIINAYNMDAISHGSEAAAFNLGVHYEYGRGVPVDYAQALMWYAYAAKANLASAQFKIGMLHELGGYGVGQNYHAALYWYQKAADQGYLLAQRQLEFLKSNKQTSCDMNNDYSVNHASDALPLKPGSWKFETVVKSINANAIEAKKSTCFIEKTFCITDSKKLPSGSFWPQLKTISDSAQEGGHVSVNLDTENSYDVTEQDAKSIGVVRIIRTKSSDNSYQYKESVRVGSPWFISASAISGEYTIDGAVTFSGECQSSR